MREPPTFPYDTIEVVYKPGPFINLADTDLGRALWDFLTRPEVMHAMVIAVRLKAAPVSAISADLLAEFGSGDPTQAPREALADGLAQRFTDGPDFTLDTVKRMFGHMIKQILHALNLRVRTRNSPARDPLGIFSTSARYRPKTKDDPK